MVMKLLQNFSRPGICSNISPVFTNVSQIRRNRKRMVIWPLDFKWLLLLLMMMILLRIPRSVKHLPKRWLFSIIWRNRLIQGDLFNPISHVYRWFIQTYQNLENSGIPFLNFLFLVNKFAPSFLVKENGMGVVVESNLLNL